MLHLVSIVKRSFIVVEFLFCVSFECTRTSLLHSESLYRNELFSKHVPITFIWNKFLKQKFQWIGFRYRLRKSKHPSARMAMVLRQNMFRYTMRKRRSQCSRMKVCCGLLPDRNKRLSDILRFGLYSVVDTFRVLFLEFDLVMYPLLGRMTQKHFPWRPLLWSLSYNMIQDFLDGVAVDSSSLFSELSMNIRLSFSKHSDPTNGAIFHIE